MLLTTLSAQNFSHPVTFRSMAYDPEKRRRGIRAFMVRTGVSGREACEQGGLSASTLSQFLTRQSDSMSDRTYQKLAEGASKILGRPVSVEEFRGDFDMTEIPRPSPIRPVGAKIAIGSFVGAGDRVHLIDGNEPIEYVQAPPGYENGGAVIVRGESGRPLYEDGDLLFYKQQELPPTDETRRAVIAEVGDDELYLKRLIPGTKRGLYHLLSMNQNTPIMLDRPVRMIARVGLVILKQ